MLKLTDHSRSRSDSASRSSNTKARVVASNPVNGNSRAGRSDQIQLTSRAQQTKSPNPYEGSAPGSVKVKVGKWGTGQNDSLLGILQSQNYSKSEIYTKDDKGLTLLDRVSQANKLKNPNLIREGQELVIPTKAEESTGTTSRTEPTTTRTEPTTTNTNNAPATNEPKVNEVKVGKWGQDSNGSLFGILKNQGFSREQILNKDGGDSLLDKVARANGLADANKIQEGATLKVPNSMEALAQMEVPEAKKIEVTRPQLTPIATIEPKPITLPEPKPIELPEIRPVGPDVKPVENTTNTVEATPTNSRVTANMGLLLDGVKEGKFKRDEFQYLNAMSNRYEETRAKFSRDGFTDDELKTLGKFETSYGVTFTRLHNSDDVQLTNGTQTATTEAGQLRIRHYEEGGQLWDNYKNQGLDSEAAIATMIRQRAEARAQGER